MLKILYDLLLPPQVYINLREVKFGVADHLAAQWYVPVFVGPFMIVAHVACLAALVRSRTQCRMPQYERRGRPEARQMFGAADAGRTLP